MEPVSSSTLDEQQIIVVTAQQLRGLIREELEPKLAHLAATLHDNRPAPGPQYLSRQLAAAESGVSLRTIDRAIGVGELRSLKRGARRLIARSDLDRWLTSAGLAEAVQRRHGSRREGGRGRRP